MVIAFHIITILLRQQLCSNIFDGDAMYILSIITIIAISSVLITKIIVETFLLHYGDFSVS